MSLLSDLPDEILNLISIRLNGFDNCSLWIASDSILRQRLVNNVITDFDIKYTIPGRYLWPGNFLKKLSKLSRLSLVADEDVYNLPIQNLELFPIPTLKFLKLNFINAYQLFHRKHLISSNHSTGPTTPSSDKYINLNDYHSNLEHLEIICILSENSFSIDFLGFLPQNLKTLSMPENYFKLNIQDPTKNLNSRIQILPRTLSSLNIRFNCPFNNKAYLDFSRLPANLTSLTTKVFLDDQTYHMIPTNLKSLALLDNPSNLEKLSPFLPTGLESLEITIDQNSSTCQLFPHLKRLENLNISSRKQTNVDHLLNNCPPNLKTLIINNFHLNLPAIGFSECLSTLVLIFVSGITAEFISSLPQSLRSLTMNQYGPKFEYFTHLPRNLESLTTNLDIVEKTSLLPESLTCLHLPTTNSYDASFFDRLPPKLETLTAHLNISHSIMRLLPATLKNLYIISAEPVDDEMIRMLPRGLKEMTFDAPDNITDAGAANLPPYLETIMLPNNMKWTDDAIALLPRSVRTLTVTQNPNFTDECIKHLPDKLVVLNMNEAKKITSKSCRSLPRYLKVLFLSKCMDWDSKILIASKNELPRYLITLRLGNQQASKTWQRILRTKMN